MLSIFFESTTCCFPCQDANIRMCLTVKGLYVTEPPATPNVNFNLLNFQSKETASARDAGKSEINGR